MSARLRRAAGIALLPTAAAAVALVALPGRATLVLHVWLLVVLGIALLALLAGILADVPRGASAFDAALAPRVTRPARPATLARLEREVSMGTETAFDTHARLRPLLRELTQGILLAHHGIDLERDPGRARTALADDDDLWSLVRPDVAPPDERGAPGISPDRLERAIASLERLAWS